MALEQIAKGLVSWAPRRLSLPKDSLQVSVDHFVQTKARGSESAKKEVGEFIRKIQLMNQRRNT